ncbi:chain length determinant protein EpsF [Paucibacter sp. Y2R2-4]|uniref:chain length determinant protein EpsF n=1 Tax=Paucibacter sp. Y2R2-4 TaxID=2893553 RepID=UPI0021E4B9EC|nr:chain length determinant protein EpsF [Paucibacter sp. Y2R2-4]MCV2349272.1 chain length determinant protein EpsF [Paucibacter sp. Y2R2-4]
MTLSQFLSILLARRWIFLAVLLGVLIPTIVVSMLLPKKYSSSASVVIDVKADPLSPMAFQSMMTPSLMATQIDIIQSDRVARRVVRTLKLSDNPQIRAQWQAETQGLADIETWLIKRFQKELSVVPSRESSVIEIAYSAVDPRFSAGLANAFAQAYIDTVLELRVDPAKQYSAFFDTRAKEARETLERAQGRLSAFQREKDVVMTDERMDIETQRLNELSSQLVAIQAMSSDANSRIAQTNAGSADKLQEISNHPVVAGLRSDLSRLEARLQEMSSKLGDSHPQVIEAKANIKELRINLDAEIKRLSAGVGISGNITRQREAQARTELEAQRAKVLRMKEVRDEGVMILRDVENAQRVYDGIMQRLNQTSLESQATSSNVSILNAAVPPLEHSSPKMLLNTALGVFVGLLLATGTVLGIELRNRRVRGVHDIEELLGLPVIGTLPDPSARRGFGKKPATDIQSRLLGHAPATSKAS